MTAGRKSITDTKHWCTPPSIIRSVRQVFADEIDLDPCSNEHSMVDAKVNYRLPEHDGLVESWDFKRIFVNPPYGSDASRGTRIAHWFTRIAEAAKRGSEVIALVPVATNTGHWKSYVYPIATAICFLYEPRVKFYINGKEDPKGAPMSCAAIYYGSDFDSFAAVFSSHGAVLPLDRVVLPEGQHHGKVQHQRWRRYLRRPHHGR
ncbi:MAG: N-6 DNA methylase [Spirochaetes bacterium]|nr:MAG: N-6 DNA methylase [Spirochaetota bacterium]